MEKYCTNASLPYPVCSDVICRAAKYLWNPGGAYLFLGFLFKGMDLDCC